MESKKITLILDASQIQELEGSGSCDLKWHYRYNECLQKWNAKSRALDIGSFVHKMLEIFYTLRSIEPKADRFLHSNIVQSLVKDKELAAPYNLSKEDVQFFKQRFTQYVINWTGHDFMPVRKNGIPGVELGFSKVLHETESHLYVVEGKIDLVAPTPAGEMAFWDNKTQGRKEELYLRKTQCLVYSWATGIRRGGFNYFKTDKKYVDNETFRRSLHFYPEWLIEKWERQMMRLFGRLESIMRENSITQMNEFRPEHFIQNLSACAGNKESWPCHYNGICENPEQADAMKKQFYFTRDRWQPWEIDESEGENADVA